MVEDEQAQWIVPTTGATTLPAVEILTGRGFVTGKSGSGKSNTASVIAEELLDNNYNMLIIDPEGEYFGLKEQYEMLHVGKDDHCDAHVTPAHADKLAEIALERNLPVILDVSDYLDGEEANELIAETVRALFQKEKDVRKPFLLMIEEMQEYFPQQGGSDELSELLERVAKRGRKRGLGMLGMSQRPSSVDKDFITQCDWMVWHRLTWQNDIDVVRNVLGSELADQVEDLETGEGYLMTDWDESVERVQFKRKKTHDAGATPGLESYERPDLRSVSHDLIREIETETQSGDNSSTNSSDLSSDEQEDLNKAIDSVEAEGNSITEQDPNFIEGDGVEAEQNTSDSNATQADVDILNEPAADPSAVENGEGSPVEDIGTDESESDDQVIVLQQRNQILKDEVKELRSILKEVDQDPKRDPSSTSETDVKQPSQDSSPSKPVPPEPPVEREGVAGNLVELVSMVGYLTRSIVYRFKLMLYRTRK